MKIKYIFLFFILIAFYSCDKFFVNDQGVITYELKYLEDEKDKPVISLLPTEMEFYYKDDNTCQKVEGWMSIFSIIGISDFKTGTKYALLKIMADKYMYKSSGSTAFGYEPMEGKKIEFTDEIKEIAGYKCKKAIVKYKGDEFDVYYTDKIKIKNPNWNNPYKEIKGVLMEYQISMFDIKTEIKAVKIENNEVDDGVFVVPDGYNEVTKQKMEDVINNLM